MHGFRAAPSAQSWNIGAGHLGCSAATTVVLRIPVSTGTLVSETGRASRRAKSRTGQPGRRSDQAARPWCFGTCRPGAALAAVAVLESGG